MVTMWMRRVCLLGNEGSVKNESAKCDEERERKEERSKKVVGRLSYTQFVPSRCERAAVSHPKEGNNSIQLILSQSVSHISSFLRRGLRKVKRYKRLDRESLSGDRRREGENKKKGSHLSHIQPWETAPTHYSQKRYLWFWGSVNPTRIIVGKLT